MTYATQANYKKNCQTWLPPTKSYGIGAGVCITEFNSRDVPDFSGVNRLLVENVKLSIQQ